MRAPAGNNVKRFDFDIENSADFPKKKKSITIQVRPTGMFRVSIYVQTLYIRIKDKRWPYIPYSKIFFFLYL